MAFSLNKLLSNQAVVYFFLVLAALNVVLYLCTKRYECLGIFLLTTYLAHFVTSNYTADIIIALLVANVVFGCGVYKEGLGAKGMEQKDEEEEEEGALPLRAVGLKYPGTLSIFGETAGTTPQSEALNA